MELSADNVVYIYLECRSKAKNESNSITVEGVKSLAIFYPEALDKNKENIKSMLSQLSDDFKQGMGGGSSFLNMCVNKDGELWTGEHGIVDRLVMLGLAIGAVQFNMPREFWRSLPGGVPYLYVKQ